LHVSSSTISVATADRVAALHKERGLRFLSAPVFGRPEAAAAAKLFVVAAGAQSDYTVASALFPAISQKVFYIGEKPSSANLVKLCGNFTILAAIEAFAEAMTLAQKGGVAKKQFLEVMTGSLFDTPVYRNYGAALAEERFRPAGFAAPLGLKDMRLVGQSAETLRVPMPVLNVLRDHLLQTIGAEGEDIDWSGIGYVIAKNGGL
jgi:3-hydroxyisobutyrate dehydrogenase-like beta-hydroxyacid dehydrogenase